jgi:DNA polymerase-3 subunit delta'
MPDLQEQPLPLPWLGQALKAALASARSHALLVQGAGGVGEFEMAVMLAQTWLCEAPQRKPDAWACGRCASCLLFNAHGHPDFKLLVPEALRETLGWMPDESETVARDAETKTSKAKPSREIKVDEVRSAIAFAQQTSSRGKAKVVLIYPAESVNLIAANALLKTLEEPAGQLRFVLASAAADALLPTLRSRCQPLPLPIPDEAQSVSWLQEQGVEQAQVLLRAAGGRPQEALMWARDGVQAKVWTSLPERVAKGDATALQDWPVPRAIDALQRLCHDLLRRQCGAEACYFPTEAIKRVRFAAPLHAWSVALKGAARHADHPLNAGLLMESLVAQGKSALMQASA